jgi:hypothetical protein
MPVQSLFNPMLLGATQNALSSKTWAGFVPSGVVSASFAAATTAVSNLVVRQNDFSNMQIKRANVTTSVTEFLVPYSEYRSSSSIPQFRVEVDRSVAGLSSETPTAVASGLATTSGYNIFVNTANGVTPQALPFEIVIIGWV